ncbi:hypothetical protein [Bifidobacterium animalis]|uniref:hypothetical protein n=1 Tax=Bifidobacterium animalis TaxID=28025 RepID=UPI00389AAB7B
MTNGTSADTREYERMLSGELYIADDPYLKDTAQASQARAGDQPFGLRRVRQA